MDAPDYTRFRAENLEKFLKSFLNAADGLTDEVKVAIMAAIAQQPGFNMANVTNVSIRKI